MGLLKDCNITAWRQTYYREIHSEEILEMLEKGYSIKAITDFVMEQEKMKRRKEALAKVESTLYKQEISNELNKNSAL